jgi:hypothetical protein
MKRTLINKVSGRLAWITSSVLIVSAAVFAVSALMAQPSMRPKTTPVPQCDWPPADNQAKEHVKKALETAMDDSITDSGLRGELLDCNPVKCDSPKKAVKRILDRLYPGNNIKFPDRVVITFYEQETQSTKIHIKSWDPSYPSNHCYSILYLDDPVGHLTSQKAVFGDHLMCCYDPW